jgi:signal transduction histidine kinase
MNLGNPEGSQAAALLDELRWEERRRAVSWVASVVAHMIGTPLNVIAGRAAMIRAEPGATATEANASRIEAQVEKLAHRLRQFIDGLEPLEPGPDMQPVGALVREAVSAYGSVARDRGLSLVVRPERLPETPVERTSTLVGLTALLSLAIRSAAAGAMIEVAVDELAERTAAIALFVPGLVLPQVELDRLEPPTPLADGDRRVVELIQVLSLCGALVRRYGGRLALIPGTPAGSSIRLQCPSGAA